MLRLFLFVGALVVACADGSSSPVHNDEPVATATAKLGAACTSVTGTVVSDHPIQANWWTSAVGSNVTFTPTASGCSPVEYRYIIQRPGQAFVELLNYPGSASFVWHTATEAPGTYNFQVLARAQGSQAAWEAYWSFPFILVQNQTCASVSTSTSPVPYLAENFTMAAAGTQVTLTSTSTGCSQPQYRISYLPPGGSWQTLREWSPEATWVWDTTGKAAGLYNFQVWVRANSEPQYEAYTGFSYRLQSTPLCSSMSTGFSPSHPGAAAPWIGSLGTKITLTNASSPCTDAEYRIYHLAPNSTTWTLVRDYPAATNVAPTPEDRNVTYEWNTANETPGTHQWQVWARGRQHQGVGYESFLYSGYILLPNAMCDGVSFTTAPSGHAPVGTLVRLNSKATSCPDPSYRYTLSPVGGPWRVIQEWTRGRPAYWNTLLEQPGLYYLQTWARNFDSTTALYETLLSGTYTLDPVTPTHAVSISGGWEHNCELLANGQVGCWGYNGNGELGNGTTTSSSSPVAVTGLTQGISLGVGYAHACAAIHGGSVVCWGDNSHGQLGNAPAVRALNFIPVNGITSASTVGAGTYHSCATLVDGSVQCWGYNNQGQLGNGTQADSVQPVTVAGITNAIQVVGGFAHTCALLDDGTVKCWGLNDKGQLGNGGSSNSLQPVAVAGLTGASSISANSNATCAVKAADGSVWCWGDPTPYGVLGNGTTSPNYQRTPVQATGISGARNVAIGEDHACVSLQDNTARCWGKNDQGQLGNGSTQNSSAATVVSGLTTVSTVGVSSGSSCATLEGNTAVCWGRGLSGELGNGSVGVSAGPVPVGDVPATSPSGGTGGVGGTGASGGATGGASTGGAGGATGGAGDTGGTGGTGGSGSCIPNCAGKPCGERIDDGCGHDCPSLCADGQPGCQQDYDCPIGSTCAIGAGPSFGFAAGTNVCWKLACDEQSPQFPNCGVPGLSCGVCALSECIADCTNRECGSNGCGGDCGTCGGETECNPDGKCVARADADLHSPKFPQSLPPDAAAATSRAGAIPGRFSVTPGGAASYAIPIVLPPGRSGLKPTLALAYTGNKADGLLGLGWQLSGFSAITRCPGRLVDARGVHPVNYDSGDNFCLDGLHLVAVSGTNGATDSEYRTEIDTFQRILLRGATYEGSTYTGPAYFEVQTRDGRLMIFGRSEDSSLRSHGVKRLWALESVQDRAGSTIVYHYLAHQVYHDLIDQEDEDWADTGELLPSSIVYGGHSSGIPGDRWINLQYETRSDPRYDYVMGARGFSLNRLHSITTVVRGTPIRSYVVSYDPARDRSLVQRVGMCPGVPGNCVGTDKDMGSTFSYGIPAPPISANGATLALVSRHVDAVLDQDGDGRSDLISRDTDTGRVHLTYSRYTGVSFNRVSTEVAWTGNTVPELTGDVNGDGWDDLIDPSGKLFIADAQNQTFAVSTYAMPSNRKVESAVAADLNGDGLADWASCLDNGDIALSFGSTSSQQLTGQASVLSVTQLGRACKQLLAFDVNGDSVPELVDLHPRIEDIGGKLVMQPLWAFQLGLTIEGPGIIRYYNTGISPSSISELKVLDFNGDGQKDVLEIRSDSVDHAFILWENTGSASAVFRQRNIELTQEGISPPWDRVTHESFKEAVVVDFDGDGRDDLISGNSMLAPAGRFQMRRSVFDRFLENPIAADINGDGSPDLIARTGDSQFRRVIFGNGGTTNLLTSIRDAQEKNISISYAPEQQDAISATVERTFKNSLRCEFLAGSDRYCGNRVGVLVSSSEEYALPNGIFQQGPKRQYWYDSLRNGLGGRGTYGFDTTRSDLFDSPGHRASSILTTFYTEDFVRAGLPKFSATVLPELPANELSEAQNYSDEARWTFEVGTSSAGLPFPKFAGRKETERDRFWGKQLTSVETTASVNEWGDLERLDVSTYREEGVLIDQESTATTYYPVDLSAWTLGLAHTVTYTSSRAAETYVRNLEFEYADGLLTDVYRERNDPYLFLHTHLVRDPVFGVVSSRTESDSGGNERTSKIDYDDNTILPTGYTDALNHVSEVKYDRATGALLTFADPNWVITRWGYDALGRLTRAQSPSASATLSYARQVQPIAETPVGPIVPVLSKEIVWSTGESKVVRTDAFGRVVSTSWSGPGSYASRENTYDSAGRLLLASLPHASNSAGEASDTTQGFTALTYDQWGRLSSVTPPSPDTVSEDGTSRRPRIEHFYANYASLKPGFVQWLEAGSAPHSVNDLSHVHVVRKARGNVQAAVTNVHGALAASIEAESLSGTSASHRARYYYGAFGRLLEREDADGGLATFSPDAWGRAGGSFDPDTGAVSRTLSAWGEVVETTDAKQQTTVARFDALGRLRRLELPSGDLVASWDYDGGDVQNYVGKLSETFRPVAPGATTGVREVLTYEAPVGGLGNAARLTSIARSFPGLGDTTFETSFGYDEAGRLDLIQYPAAPGSHLGDPRATLDVRREYDSFSGALVKLKNDSSGEVYWRAAAGDGLRFREEWLDADSLKTEQDFYSLTNTDPSCASTEDAGCYPGLLKSLTTKRVAGGFAIQQSAYQYDKNANLRKRSRIDGNVEGFGYDFFDQLTSHYREADGVSVELEAFAYGPSGQITSRSTVGLYDYASGVHPPHAPHWAGDTELTYDANGNQENRVGSLVEGGFQHLDYNEFDMPVRITQGLSAPAVTEFMYNAHRARVAKLSDTEKVYYAGDGYEFVLKGDVAEHHYKIWNDERQVAEITKLEVGGVVTETRSQFLHQDHLGSTEVVSSGSTDTPRAYSPFGETQGSFASGVRAGFTGHDQDAELGLIDMRGRVYDPRLGLFLQADPVISSANPRAINPYAYVLNNPLSFTDPSGFIGFPKFSPTSGIDLSDTKTNDGSKDTKDVSAASGYVQGVVSDLVGGDAGGDGLPPGLSSEITGPSPTGPLDEAQASGAGIGASEWDAGGRPAPAGDEGPFVIPGVMSGPGTTAERPSAGTASGVSWGTGYGANLGGGDPYAPSPGSGAALGRVSGNHLGEPLELTLGAATGALLPTALFAGAVVGTCAAIPSCNAGMTRIASGVARWAESLWHARPGDLPVKGPPDSSAVVDRGNGRGTIRDYGPDGVADTDYDFGHDHGAGDPHAHDWDKSGPKPRRLPGRPLSPGE